MAAVAPLLKWPGGKRKLAGRIWAALLHKERRLVSYVEPFVGSGAAYIGRPTDVQLDHVSLSDVNGRLIGLHRTVVDAPDALVAALARLAHLRLPDHYAAVRDAYNATGEPALLCWLNRACFNGLYRENRAGAFNVPVGSAMGPLPSAQAIHAVRAAMLRGVGQLVVQHQGYREALEHLLTLPTLSGVGVYLDPPYIVEARALDGCSGFTSYSSGGFNVADHVELVRLATAAASRGARVVCSGCSGWITEQVYLGGHSSFRVHERLTVTRSIGASASTRKPSIEWLLVAGD